MDKRILPAVLIVLAVLVIGLVFWSQHKETAEHTLPPNSSKQIADRQIQDIQNSKYLTPEQKADQIARIRAFNHNLGKRSDGSP